MSLRERWREGGMGGGAGWVGVGGSRSIDSVPSSSPLVVVLVVVDVGFGNRIAWRENRAEASSRNKTMSDEK